MTRFLGAHASCELLEAIGIDPSGTSVPDARPSTEERGMSGLDVPSLDLYTAGVNFDNDISESHRLASINDQALSFHP
jgi:hypothetical protein